MKLTNKELIERLKKIKVLVLDCDGVLTDAKVLTGVVKDDRGNVIQSFESAVFCIPDGKGLQLIREKEVDVFIVSSQASRYVGVRAEKIKVDYVQGEKGKDKLGSLRKWLSEKHPEVSLKDVAFIGDDLEDFKVMQAVGIPITVRDGAPEIKRLSCYVTKAKGGERAVREICDLILASKNL